MTAHTLNSSPCEETGHGSPDQHATPAFVVVFISQRTDGDAGYAATARRMVELAEKQPGFMGAASTRDHTGQGITVSYWRSLADIERWKGDAEHMAAQQSGKEQWYASFRLTVARVERDHMWTAE
jgi:heme-degrading monooxygenase HmoA